MRLEADTGIDAGGFSILRLSNPLFPGRSFIRNAVAHATNL